MFSTAFKIVDSYDSDKENEFSEKTNLFELGNVVNNSRKYITLCSRSTYIEETGFGNFDGGKMKGRQKILFGATAYKLFPRPR